eukprot:scaffold39830_cov28-Attheya_sp.AAC.1
MICTPGHISGRQSDYVYERRMTGSGDNFQTRQRRRVTCSICKGSFAHSSLATHRRVQHGETTMSGQHEPAPAVGLPAEYRVSFPKTVSKIDCPIEGCPGRATSRANLRVHFMHRHARDTLVILEEGSFPNPRCEFCDMFVPRPAIHTTHPRTEMCRKGADRKWQRLAKEDARRATEH